MRPPLSDNGLNIPLPNVPPFNGLSRLDESSNGFSKKSSVNSGLSNKACCYCVTCSAILLTELDRFQVDDFLGIKLMAFSGCTAVLAADKTANAFFPREKSLGETSSLL